MSDWQHTWNLVCTSGSTRSGAMKAIWEKAEHAATAKVLSCNNTRAYSCHSTTLYFKSTAALLSKHRCRQIKCCDDGTVAKTLR